jgi:hypothetical protein
MIWKGIVTLLMLMVFYSTGFNLDLSSAVKQDIMKFSAQDAIDISTNVSFLFIPQLIELEKQEVGIFGKCKVFTDPLTPEKLGLSFEQYGVIDTIKAQYLQGLYGSYSDVAYVVDEEQLIEYANCLLRYGAIIAQAQLNLYGNLKQFGKVLKKRIKGEIELKRLKSIIKKALLEAMNGRYSPQIQRWLSIKISGPCKFAGNQNIMCGAYLLKLQPPQQLLLQSFPIFSEHFFGIGGYIRISKSAGAENTAFEYIPVKNQ